MIFLQSAIQIEFGYAYSRKLQTFIDSTWTKEKKVKDWCRVSFSKIRMAYDSLWKNFSKIPILLTSYRRETLTNHRAWLNLCIIMIGWCFLMLVTR